MVRRVLYIFFFLLLNNHRIYYCVNSSLSIIDATYSFIYHLNSLYYAIFLKQSMLDYFLSTREEVFFMAVRDRMALSTNTIKEK